MLSRTDRTSAASVIRRRGASSAPVERVRTWYLDEQHIDAFKQLDLALPESPRLQDGSPYGSVVLLCAQVLDGSVDIWDL